MLSTEVAKRARTLAPGHEVLSGSRVDVLTELRRGVQRGEFVQTSNVALAGDRRTFFVTIRRFRPPVPAWRKRVLPASAVLGVLALATWLMVTLAAALATLAGMAVVSLVAGAFITMALRRRGGGETIVEVLTRVTVRR